MYSGILLSVSASCIFASLYYYTSLLSPLSGEQVFGWRIVLTLPFLTLFMLLTKDIKLVQQLCLRIKE